MHDIMAIPKPDPFTILPVAKWTAQDIARKLGAKSPIPPIDAALLPHSPQGGSAISRIMKCPGSVTLIQTFKASPSYVEDDPDFRRDGVQAHSLGEHCLVSDVDAWEAAGEPQFPDLTAEMMMAVQEYIDFVRLQPGTREVEVRVHLPDFHGDFYGTIDCVLIEYAEDGKILRIHVIDYKHGVGIVVEVIENPQLMYYAWGKIAKVLHLLTDETPVKLTIVQPRAIHRSGTIRTWETTVGHIRDWAENILKPAMEVTADIEYLELGEHCRFCPAKTVCPAMEGLGKRALRAGIDAITYAEAQVLKMLVKAKEEAVERELLAGGDPEVIGAKLVAKRGFRVFKGGAPLVEKFGDDAWERKLKSPAAVEKLPGGKAFVAEYAFMPPSEGVRVVPLNDQASAVEGKPLSLEEKYGEPGK